VPGMISLGGGLPNPSLFPIHSLKFSVGNREIELSPREAANALQYSPTPGLPDLIGFLHRLQQDEHGPPRPVRTFRSLP
jgi:kynurenine/2-aminoadipate aminotransferase